MFGIGILSLMQAWFLPGLSLLVLSKKLKLIDKLILSLPLSISLNYILVFILVLTKSYNQLSLYILISIELFLIIYFLKKNNNDVKNLKSALRFLEFSNLKIKFNIIDLIAILIFLIYLFLAVSNIGNVIGKGDPVTYYNWTLDIINNKIPTQSYDYPQAAAILGSISFVLLNTLKIEFFSAAIFLIQPLWIFFIFYRTAFILKTYENEIKYSLIFTSLIILYNFRHYLLFINLPDATVALGTVVAGYVLILFFKNVQIGLNLHTILLSIAVSFPALLKQVGIYTSFIFPILYLILFYNKDKKIFNNFILICSVIFLIISPWYILRFYEYFILGLDQSSALGIASSYNVYDNFFIYSFEVLYRLFGLSFIPILFLIIFSFKKKIAQNIFLVFLLPYYIIYIFLFGYEFRAFAPAMAVVGILCGIGLSNFVEFLNSTYNKTKLLSLYKLLVFLFIVFSIFSLNELRNYQKLVTLNIEATKKRGDYRLNVLLYHFLNKKDKIKNVYVIRDYNNLSLLPEMNHEFIDTPCNEFQTVQKKNFYNSYYILIDLREIYSEKFRDICSLNVLNFINNSNEKKYLKKIFEHKNYILFLRKFQY